MSAPVDVLAVIDRAAESAGEIVKASNGDFRAVIYQDDLFKARAAVAELIAYADSALHYVDEAAKAERERHQRNGAPNSQVLAQTVADNLRAALARAGGA